MTTHLTMLFYGVLHTNQTDFSRIQLRESLHGSKEEINSNVSFCRNFVVPSSVRGDTIVASERISISDNMIIRSQNVVSQVRKLISSN